ncbi:unnamed protein product [Trichobilharzia regenti]|nr:unnamed protein product [Trichobilharzia regenti]
MYFMLSCNTKRVSQKCFSVAICSSTIRHFRVCTCYFYFLVSKSEYLIDSCKRNSLSDSSEVHSDIGISSSAGRQPIWLRFTKEHNPINNAWSCFQSYRATVGLLAFTWCASRQEIEAGIRDYAKHKDSLLLGEVTCHPSNHLFEEENILKDSGVYTTTDECSVAEKSPNPIRPPFINHRISSVLQELVTTIYWSLKKMITARCSSDIKFKKKETQSSKEQGDSNDDVLMAPEENETKWNIVDEAKRRVLGRTNALSALSSFTERSGAISSVSAQADVRSVML